MGDIVDRGPRIREALHIVKDMVDQSQAEIVLGNHEYNAMCYCTEGRQGSGMQYLREHNARHHRLIRETLEQFDAHRSEWHKFLSWFHEIPLFIEKEDFRVVHACWDSLAIERLKSYSPDHCISMDFLHESAVSGSFASRIIDKLTRGTALELPNGETILGKDGLARSMFRTKFWSDDPQIYNDVVFQPDPLPPEMAERPLSAIEKQQLLTYPTTEAPVFVGHYWMSGEPEPIQCNIACLDYSAVKYGQLVAYRMDGERVLSKDKFVSVDVTRT
ncbi:serine/threonine protein phosphatase [Oleiphilus sp. HI0072]|nr:serine/threonine protein phosphatase [Oleiphilus sp. HI0072]